MNDATSTIQAGTRRGWRWLLVFGLLYALLVGKLGLISLIGLMHDTARFNSEISRLQARYASLETDYRNYTSDPSAIEKVAREELEFGKKGEVVFKFLPKK